MAEEEDPVDESEDGAETGGDLCDADAQLDDDEITSVAGAVLGGDAAGWFAEPLPALDNLSPATVLRDHPRGADIVRSLLVRMR